MNTLTSISATIFLTLAISTRSTFASSISCTAGTYTPDGSVCLVCPSMTFALAGATSCSPCPEGTSSPQESGSCTINGATCPSGSQRKSGSTECEACLKDHFSDEITNFVCKPCAPGGSSPAGWNICRWTGGFIPDPKSELISSTSSTTTANTASLLTTDGFQCFGGAIGCRPGYGFKRLHGSCKYCKAGSYSGGGISACLPCKSALVDGAKACAPIRVFKAASKLPAVIKST